MVTGRSFTGEWMDRKSDPRDNTNDDALYDPRRECQHLDKAEERLLSSGM
jgi:hypothetical protein